MPAHDATTLVHRHHPVIHVGAGPVCVWVLCTRFIGVQQCLCKCILFYLYYSQTKKLRNTETKGSRETDSSLKTSELTLPPQSNPLLSLLRINVCVSLPLPPPVLPPPRPFSSSDHRTFSSCFILLERCQNIETNVKWFDLFFFQHFTPLLQDLSLRVIMHVLSVTIISQHTRTTTHTYTHNTHTHTHTRTHTRTRTCTCTHTHSHTHAHTRTHTHARARARARVHTPNACTHILSYARACLRAILYTQTHTQTRKHSSTHANKCNMCAHTNTQTDIVSLSYERKYLLQSSGLSLNECIALNRQRQGQGQGQGQGQRQRDRDRDRGRDRDRDRDRDRNRDRGIDTETTTENQGTYHIKNISICASMRCLVGRRK